jgi:hypothetical protein
MRRWRRGRKEQKAEEMQHGRWRLYVETAKKEEEKNKTCTRRKKEGKNAKASMYKYTINF